MRKITLVSAVALTFVTAFLASPVYGQAFTETTIVLNGVAPFGEGPNPCTGLMDTGTITYNGVMHITASPKGALLTGTQTGDIMVVSENGVVYTGHITASFKGRIQLTADGGFVSTSTFAGRARGSDGSTVQVTGVFHVTVNSFTEPPVVEFSNFTLRCT